MSDLYGAPPPQYGYGQPPPMPYPLASGQTQDVAISVKPDKNDRHKNSGKNDVHRSKIKFNESPEYKDVWATVVFLLTELVTIVIACVSIPNIGNSNLLDDNNNSTSSNTGKSSNSTSSSHNSNGKYMVSLHKRSEDGTSVVDIITMLCSGIGSSILFTFCYMVLMQKYAGKMIKGTFIISIAFSLIYALIFLFISPVMGIIMVVFALLYALCYFFWRSRIPFAKVMLKTVTAVTRKYPATIFVGIVSCIVSSIWNVFMLITLLASYLYFTDKNDDTGGYIASVITVFLVFSFYFSSQVIKNTVHVTISGVFATYYFRGVVDPKTKDIQVDVKNPTVKSFKRAVTTSFGPICFGSLVIAVIRTLEYLARQLKEKGSEDNNAVFVIIGCCIECILSYIGNIIEYFNVYAFTEVAIYGKSFWEAAKDTWEICKDHGIEALINDNLIGNVLNIGAICVACMCVVLTCAIGFLILGIKEIVVLVIFGIIAFFFGFVVFSIVAQVINSGVATTFVCICEDPDALHYTKPELWEKVKETFSSVVL